MVAIVDYGVGNLFSLRSSFAAIGHEALVTADPAVLERADRIVLPGVGAFGDAAEKLRQTGLDRVLLRLAGEGKPILGICLGMQLLFEKSLEFGCHEGLGLLPGAVVPLKGYVPESCKIPHMGWNALEIKPHPLFAHTRPGDFVYFVHSFYAQCPREVVIASADYGAPVTAAVAKGNVMGCQFHPEKSGDVGLAILKAFCEEENLC